MVPQLTAEQEAKEATIQNVPRERDFMGRAIFASATAAADADVAPLEVTEADAAALAALPALTHLSLPHQNFHLEAFQVRADFAATPSLDGPADTTCRSCS